MNSKDMNSMKMLISKITIRISYDYFFSKNRKSPCILTLGKFTKDQISWGLRSCLQI